MMVKERAMENHSEKICQKCHKPFSTNNDSLKCYHCYLIEFSAGRCPEEGEINSAMVCSGTMTEQEEQLLRKELYAIDNSDQEEEICEDPRYF